MRARLRSLLTGLALLAATAVHAQSGGGSGSGAASQICTGKFVNPITDICWSCVLPISIGAVPLGTFGQDDIENPPIPLCMCGIPPFARYGISVGFWEPVLQVDVTRTPYCMVGLGGMKMNFGIKAPEHAQYTRSSGVATGAFYQVHLYHNPVLYWLGVLLDDACVAAGGGMDLLYLSEVDPLWNDDELSMIVNPDAVLFANPIAIAACAADCVAATVGFGFQAMYWCAGCQGGVFPLDGHIPAHIGGAQSSVLLTQRLLTKTHRMGLSWQYHGFAALCGPHPAPLIDKRAYKTQLTYPIPNTAKIAGQCCQPFGRTTILWGAGKEYPYLGEDYSYLLFRKRNCCAD